MFILNRWGVNETIKSHAQHLSDITGIHTVVPDLYKGKIGLTAEVSYKKKKCIIYHIYI